MVNWFSVIIGFILAIVVRSFDYSWSQELVGLLIVGFIVGYIAKEGAIGGLINASIAGALGTIIGAILFTILGLFFGLFGFLLFGFGGLMAVIVKLIYYAIVMGITGAIGGYLAGDRHGY